MRNKIFNKNVLPIVLVLMVILNYLPLIVLNCTIKASKAAGISTLVPAFGIGFVYLFFFFIKKIKITKPMLIEIILLFFMTIMWSIVQIINFKSGSYYLNDIFNIFCKFVNVLFLFILAMNIEIEEKYLLNFMKGMVLFGLIACIFNMIFYSQDILASLKIISIDGKIAIPKSFFAQKNQFAYVLFTCIVACITLITSTTKTKSKLIYCGLILLFLFNMVFTTSRTAFVITGLFMFLYLIFNNQMKFSRKIITLLIIGLIGAGLVYLLYIYNPELLLDKLIRSKSFGTLTGRTKIWDVALGVASESKATLLFGAGRFKGIDVLQKAKKPFTQFHNTYIEFLVSGGICELIYFLAIYLFVIIKLVKSNSLDKKYKILFICLYISYFVYMFSESLGRFSIGGSDCLGLIFFVSIPLLFANTIERKVLDKGKEEE